MNVPNEVNEVVHPETLPGLHKFLTQQCQNHVDPAFDPENNLHNNPQNYHGPSAHYIIHSGDVTVPDDKVFFYRSTRGLLAMYLCGKKHTYRDVYRVMFVGSDGQAQMLWNRDWSVKQSILAIDNEVMSAIQRVHL